MSYTLACERPDLFRAIGSVTGNMSAYDQTNCNPDNVIPIIHLHGTLDPTVSYNQGVILDGPWSGGWGVEEVMGFWTEQMGATESTEEAMPNAVLLDFTTVDFIRHYGAPGGQEFHHYRVNGGGHDWFGAWGNQDIDSTDLIWEFFSSACEESANSILDYPLSVTPAKRLLRVMDLMGRTTEIVPDQLLLYLFSDGSVEKRMELNGFKGEHSGPCHALPQIRVFLKQVFAGSPYILLRDERKSNDERSFRDFFVEFVWTSSRAEL